MKILIFLITAEQFLFDRSKQQNIASFITEPDIIEDNEDNEERTISFNEEGVVFTWITGVELPIFKRSCLCHA